MSGYWVLCSPAWLGCMDCGQELVLEPMPMNWRTLLGPPWHAIGACHNKQCPRYEKRMKIVVPVMACEDL